MADLSAAGMCAAARRGNKRLAQDISLAIALAAGGSVTLYAPTRDEGEACVERARKMLRDAGVEERGTVRVAAPGHALKAPLLEDDRG